MSTILVFRQTAGFIRNSTAPVACAFALSVGLANSAQAQSLEALCPGAPEQVADALQRTAREQNTAGWVQVRAQAEAGALVAVQTTASARPFERAVRHALRGVACDANASAALQFSVFFADPVADPHGSAALAQSRIQPLPQQVTATLATAQKR